ncbi:carbon monoxide dehydrogenase subunit G [Rhizorhapis sp.]|uniref:SRPBCC family protein n=1 Tax=Rhizorhapis sp. TaxID=1968842 RepID=UPI002B496AC2|nr:carbon monoxide dehydrogenase subunit G [Rhizorhapis sp.]HKR17973.1 carbon monoxide dehydrogenase subunit G [Rhizorhapis sp.]HKX35415.1 carbon monoxide dehydrogenase subunit G [Rhizorhapis sp.]
MDMTGEQRIPADRDTVWKALNDVEILKTSIPGCQELVKESDTEMTAIAVVKVGPISARFQGRVTLSDLDPPNGYRISGEGQGGVAGHARGGAVVQLIEDGGETILRYEASAQVGGRLAQLGGRMIDATARSMSAAFFKKFAQEITERQAAATVAETAPVEAAAAVPAPPRPVPVTAGQPRSAISAWLWVACGLLLGALLAGLFGMQPLVPGREGMLRPDTLALVAILLALLQGYLLGRHRA